MKIIEKYIHKGIKEIMEVRIYAKLLKDIQML